jgi:HTH-type transcriptional regulator/antitoxin HipB
MIAVMLLRTPRDIGALIRQKRRDLNLDQRTLASRVGVSRQWIIGAEAGKPTVELALVLRTLDALEIHLTTTESPKLKPRTAPPAPDIDAIVRAARKK